MNAPRTDASCPPATVATRLPGPSRLGLALVCATLFAGGHANAEFRLASVFGNNMLIQRNQAVRVWGQCNPGAAVQVGFGEQRVAAKAGSDGSWEVSLAPVPAGGPYTLSATAGGSSVTLTNVLCGDVWLCSGQSNMQLPVKQTDPAEQNTVLVERPNLRLCAVAKAHSARPLPSADIQWRVCTPNAARDFSAVACFFASELAKDQALANVPIGLVDSSFGGTTCEGWIPQPALAAFAAKDLHDSLFGIKPANLYNAMVAPLGRTAFKGVIWYQGESNSAHPETYPALLATMISEWRRQFGQPALPFLLVQLPEYANLWEGFYWPWIRERQAQAAQSIPQTALVVAIGTTDGFNLHPTEKQEIGRRAALAARKLVYGESVVARGPVFQTASVEGSTIRVTLDTGDDGLASTTADGVRGFALAGADGEYRFARAKIDGESVVVESREVPQPTTVRYAWGAMPQASLVNKSGLPAAPFRTDTLPPVNAEIQRQRVTRRVSTAAYEIVIDANGMPASLVFKGAQFLSNEPGTAGGASIPGFWGPRTLANIREIGPQLLACSDEDVTLQMAFGEKSMEWTITNRGKEPIRFQLALSPHVKGPVLVTKGRSTLVRGNASLTVAGFESVTNTPNGAVLISAIPAGTVKSISIR